MKYIWSRGNRLGFGFSINYFPSWSLSFWFGPWVINLFWNPSEEVERE